MAIAVVKAGSQTPSMSLLALVFTAPAAANNSRVWVEYIRSERNPADPSQGAGPTTPASPVGLHLVNGLSTPHRRDLTKCIPLEVEVHWQGSSAPA